MANRTVKIGVMTYKGADGFPRVAFNGDEVEVQADELERFDALNNYGEPEGKKAEGAKSPERKPAPEKSKG